MPQVLEVRIGCDFPHLTRSFVHFLCFFSATFLILPMADRHSGLTAKRSSSGLGDSRPKSGEKSAICQDRSIKLFRHGRSKTASNLATRSRIFGHPELKPG